MVRRRHSPIFGKSADARLALCFAPHAKHCRRLSEGGFSRHERPEPVWTVRSHGHARVLRTRTSQSLVHPGICFGVRARVRLWIPAGSLALWNCRRRLGPGSGPTLVAYGQGFVTRGLLPPFAQKRALV